jgi:hypothetical protein
MSETGGYNVTTREGPALRISRRRRSPRVSARFALWLRREEAGRTWEEETETRLVSRFGAGLECRHLVEPGANLAITRRDTGRRATARVAYRRFSEDGCREIGVELVGCENFWELEWGTLAEEAPQKALEDPNVSALDDAIVSPADGVETSAADISALPPTDWGPDVAASPAAWDVNGTSRATDDTLEPADHKNAGENGAAAQASFDPPLKPRIVSTLIWLRACCRRLLERVKAIPTRIALTSLRRLALARGYLERIFTANDTGPDVFAEALIAHEQRLWEALAQGDAQLLDNLVARDALWITHEGPQSIHSGVLGDADDNTLDPERLRTTAKGPLKDFRVLRLDGGAAIVTFTELVDEVTTYHTSVWVERGDQRQLVLHQITASR